MTTTLRAKFDGKVFVPEGDVDLPVGTSVRVDVTPSTPKRGATAEDLRALLARHGIDVSAMEEIEKRVEEDCERIDHDGW